MKEIGNLKNLKRPNTTSNNYEIILYLYLISLVTLFKFSGIYKDICLSKLMKYII